MISRRDRARLEAGLAAIIGRCDTGSDTPVLWTAVRRAVFPGGQRLRPMLLLAVARSYGRVSGAAFQLACATELLHCASLVQDDLPCFDQGERRHGLPCLHVDFGPATAVLASDVLIARAFGTAAGTRVPARLQRPAITVLADAVGGARGMAVGQHLDSMGRQCHDKTSPLFAAATTLGAAAAGADPRRWGAVGRRLGECYQMIDDIDDGESSSRREDVVAQARETLDATLPDPPRRPELLGWLVGLLQGRRCDCS